MNLQQLSQLGAPINVTVSLADLREWSGEILGQAIKNVLPRSEKKEKTLLTTAEAAQLLHVDRCTLYRWEREDYLTSLRMGKRKRYKMEDIQRALEK